MESHYGQQLRLTNERDYAWPVACAERWMLEISTTPSTIPKSIKERHEVGDFSGCAQNCLGHRGYHLAFRNHLSHLRTFMTPTVTSQSSVKFSSNALIGHHRSLRRIRAESVTISQPTSGERFIDDSIHMSMDSCRFFILSLRRRRERHP